MSHNRGFTLIELLVVIVIIGILVAIALPNFIRVKEKAMEAQVQANLRVIRVAAERYATEHDGKYPYWLLGGHFLDPNVSPMGPVFNPFCAQGFCGDGDALVIWGFLSNYPKNPFVSAGAAQNFSIPGMTWQNSDGSSIPGWSNSNSGQGNDCFSSPTIAAQTGGGNLSAGRRVGGPESDRMFDVSEGLYGCRGDGRPGGPGASRGWQGHPPPPPLPDQNSGVNCSNQMCATTRRYQQPFMPGNFYYYPIYGQMPLHTGGAWQGTAPYGYHFAAYGAVSNRGHDVYDATGDYRENTVFCEGDIPYNDVDGDNRLDCKDSRYSDIYNGPDGTPDGVITVMSSGVDAKVPMDSQDQAGMQE
jgi:prepilin-type N-terminal cleavage/methylation domain-containing protein